jgi:hypothetical protein
MCSEIYFHDFDADVYSAEDLLNITGVLIPDRDYETINLADCLCQVDIPATLDKAGYAGCYSYNRDTGWYFVMSGVKHSPFVEMSGRKPEVCL